MNELTPEAVSSRVRASIARFDSILDDIDEAGAEQGWRKQSEIRAPSKAHLILADPSSSSYTSAGPDFATAVWMARSRDYEEQRAGKAMLEQIGSRYQDMFSSKATLGDTDAAGGYVVPRIIGEPIESSTAASPVRALLNVVKVRSGAAVQIPLEGPSPARAVIAARGTTKQNQNFTLGNYSATFYTIARIFDVSNQLLRQSNGAAEKLVRSRLARAFALGENYYVLQGSGTDEPKGILTSVAAGPAAMTSSHTAADTTIAGSVRRAVATMAEALAARGRDPDGLLMNPGDLAHAAAQGSDSGGFWTSGTMGDIGLPGVRVFTSASVPSKTAILGEWKSADLYVGEDYRIDVSSEAGDRWDLNLTGFRGEGEIGFNADPYVAAGLFQVVTTLIP